MKPLEHPTRPYAYIGRGTPEGMGPFFTPCGTGIIATNGGNREQSSGRRDQ